MSKRNLMLHACGFASVLAAAAAVGAEPPGQSQAGTKPAPSGQQIATQGMAGAAPCSSCHGQQGEGNAAAGFPRIAGQSEAYLARQLESYANGMRKNPVMEPIAKALDAPQRQAVSAYYAQLPPGGDAAAAGKGTPAKGASTSTGGATKGSQAKPPQLATVGDDKRQIQACSNCHGPGGIGEPPEFPYLAGQHESYLAATLGEWKSGARNNDPTGQMSIIGRRLNDADIKALAQYFSSQPPAPGAARMLSITPPKASGAAPAGGQQATPAQGVGVEPSESTRGGAQGPGGGGAASGSGPSGSRSGNAR